MLQIKKGFVALSIACLFSMPVYAIQPSQVARGPLFGAFCYWVTKGLGYGVPITIAATTVGAAGGTVANIVASAGQTSATALVSTASSTILPSTTIAALEGIPVVGFTAAAPGAATLTAVQEAAILANWEAPYLAAHLADAAIYGAEMLPYGTPMINAAAGGVAAGKAIIATIGVEAAGAMVGTATAVTNGAVGYVAAVESAATAAAIAGTAVPFLP